MGHHAPVAKQEGAGAPTTEPMRAVIGGLGAASPAALSAGPPPALVTMDHTESNVETTTQGVGTTVHGTSQKGPGVTRGGRSASEGTLGTAGGGLGLRSMGFEEMGRLPRRRCHRGGDFAPLRWLVTRSRRRRSPSDVLPRRGRIIRLAARTRGCVLGNGTRDIRVPDETGKQHDESNESDDRSEQSVRRRAWTVVGLVVEAYE